MAEGPNLAALSAIYQAERADASTIQNNALAIMGASLAYLIGTVALWDKFTVLEGWIAALPAPLVCVSAYHSLLLTEALAKVRSIVVLERHLKSGANAALNLDDAGAMSSERIMNIYATRRWEHKANIAISYGGVGFVFLGYTGLLLARSADFIGGWVAAPAACYAVLFAIVGRSWLNVLRASSSIVDMQRQG